MSSDGLRMLASNNVAMIWVWYLLLLAVLLVGAVVNVLGLPGLWVMILGATGYAWRTGWQYISARTVLVLIGLGIVAEISELVAGGAGAKRAGGSRRAAWGAVIGGLAGALFLSIPVPILGTLIGLFIGVFAGAVAGEMWARSDPAQSVRVGVAATKGRLIGIAIKVGFSVVILLVALWTARPWQRAAPHSQSSPSTSSLAP